MKNLFATTLFTALMLVAGCATMNKSECLNADWRMIGFEDGSAGRTKASIGEHRRACAKHDVTPDLDAYNAGHDEGLRTFCTESNGFRFGHAAGAYGGVCPADLEPAFLSAYRLGRDLHEAEQALQEVRATIAGYQRQIASATKALELEEKRLIEEGSTEEVRRQLLEEMRSLRREIADATNALARAEFELPFREQELESLQRFVEY